MDYWEMAEEIMAIRADQLKTQAFQQMSKLIKGELLALDYLAKRNHSVHPKELGEKMVVSTARIAVILNQMESKKWITRTPDPEDNRQILVTLTEEGRRIVEQRRKGAVEAMTHILENLGPKDAAEFLRIMRRIATMG